MSSKGPVELLRVLLVEDDANDAELLIDALRGEGIEVDPRVVDTEAAIGRLWTASIRTS